MSLASPAPTAEAPAVVVEVVPDVTGIDRSFDYLCGAELGPVPPGTLVRVPLGPRRVHAWVVGPGAFDPSGPTLRRVEAVLSLGPPPEVVELARFATWRYAGWLRPFLGAASPERLTTSLPQPAPARRKVEALDERIAAVLAQAEAGAVTVVQLAPSSSRLEIVLGLLGRIAVGTDLLVLVAEHRDEELLVARLERLGHPVARYPRDWGACAAGGRIVVGTRNAVFAPVARLGAVLVLDAHEESYVSERAPTFSAVVLAAQRAKRAGVACVLTSPTPSLELLALGTLVEMDMPRLRAGWPAVEVLDRRGDDPRSGLYAERLATIIRAARAEHPQLPVVCVLNRRGRARLLSCGSCGELVRCESCGAALVEAEAPIPGAARVLSCPACHTERPVVCAGCGSRRLRLLRIGVARAREELAALIGATVVEVTGATGPVEGRPEVVVGTEAVLHRVRAASLVVFLDFDQHLLAPRYRASEQALFLLARAARLLAGRTGARLVVQTRMPDAVVIEAARRGDPRLLTTEELPRRAALRLPPFSALAELAGEGAAALAASLPPGLEVSTTDPGRVLLRAPDHEVLCGALAGVGPHLGVRIAVDPIGA